MARELSIHLELRGANAKGEGGVQCIVPNDPTKVWVTPATIHEQELFAYVAELEAHLEALSIREIERKSRPKPSAPKHKPDLTFVTLPGLELAGRPEVPQPNGPHGPRKTKVDTSSPAYQAQKAKVMEYLAMHQGESLKSADHRAEPWSATEDAIAADYSLTAYEVAELLGRTFYGVANRRAILKRQAKLNGGTP